MNELNLMSSILPLQPSEGVQSAVQNLSNSLHLLIDRFKSVKSDYYRIRSEFDEFTNFNPDIDPNFIALKNRIQELEAQNVEFNEIFDEYEAKMALMQSYKTTIETLGRENSNLKEEINKHEINYRRLISQVADNEDFTVKLEEKDELIAELLSDKNQLNEKIAELEEVQKNFIFAQQELARRNHQLNAYVEEILTHKNQIAELENRIFDFQNKNKNLNEQISLTEGMSDDYAVLVTQSGALDSKIKELNFELEKKDDEIKRVSEDLNNSQKNNIDLNLKLAEFENELKEMNISNLKDIELMKEENRLLREENQKVNAEITGIKENHIQESLNFEDNEQQVTDLKKFIEKLNNELLESEKINIVLRDNLLNQKADFDTQFTNLEREKLVLIQEIEGIKAEFDKVQQDSDKSKSKVLLSESINSELEQNRNQIAELQSKLAVMEDKNHESSILIQNLKDQILIQKQQIEEFKVLNRSLTENQKKQSQTLSIFEENYQENEKFELLQEEIRTREQEIADIAKELTGLRNTFDSLSNENLNLKIQLEQLSRETPKNVPTEEDLILFEEVKLELLKEMKDLRAELSDNQTKIEEARKLNSELENSISLMHQQIYKKDERITELLQFESEFHQNQKEIQELKVQLNTINHQIFKANQEKMEQDNKVFSLIKENNSVQSKVEKLSSTLDLFEESIKQKDENLQTFVEKERMLVALENEKRQDKEKLNSFVQAQIAKLNNIMND